MRPAIASLAALAGAFFAGAVTAYRWGVVDGHKEADRLLRLGRESQRE